MKLPYYELVERSIRELSIQGKPDSLYEPASYMMSLGGKRIRPILVLMGSALFGGNPEEALHPAIAMEVFHNFTLVHDDFMDNASLRRGKTTVHEKWNVPTAILSGDMMLIYAYQLLCDARTKDLERLIRLFNETAIKVCEGQQWDMEFQSRKDITIEEYTHMIGLKTAVLLAGCLKMGALLADAPQEQADLLYDFGYKLGVSFQVQDDLLDSFGDASTFGKVIGGDIAENKKTFLALKAYELADASVQVELDKLAGELDLEKKISGTLAIYGQLKVKQHTEDLREKYYLEALEALNRIAVEDARKQHLRTVAAVLLNRIK